MMHLLRNRLVDTPDRNAIQKLMTACDNPVESVTKRPAKPGTAFLCNSIDKTVIRISLADME